MRKFFVIMTVALLSGCTQLSQSSGQRVKVVTSFYPLFEIAEQVGGDHVDVKNLVPPGAEPHDYDLTPRDIASVYDSQILLMNGVGLEPWADKILPDLQHQQQVRVIDESTNVTDLIQGDPHIWLDPIQYSQEVAAFEKTISELDPSNKEYYLARSQHFESSLSDLDQTYQNGLRNCRINEFITNHAAFAYLARRYHLMMNAISGFSPDAEPSSKTMSDFISLVKQKNIRYILTESLVSPKIADTIASEAGAQTLVLNPLEGLTDQEISEGKSYVTVMRQNLKNLQTALNCG